MRSFFIYTIMNYENIYNKIIEKSKNRILEGYVEKHHILPKCIGGDNSNGNIAILTAKEHFICHKLLCEIYKNNNKLKYAYWLMCIVSNKHQIRDYKISSKEYKRLKEEMSIIRSNQMIGKRLGFKHSDETIEKIKISRSKQVFTEESNIKKSNSLKNNKNALGVKHSNEQNNNKSIIMRELRGKKCIINGIEFDTIIDASKYFNIPQNTLSNKLKNNDNIYINLEKIIINGMEFKTISEASKYFNISYTTLSYRIKNNLLLFVKTNKEKK